MPDRRRGICIPVLLVSLSTALLVPQCTRADPVRVELHRQPSIRPLDLVAGRGAFDGEDFVVAAGDAHPAWIPAIGDSRMRGESVFAPNSPRVDREYGFS